MKPTEPPGIEIFGPESWPTWYEGVTNYYYWYVYQPPKLSRNDRNKLKSLGWKLQRYKTYNHNHPRNNKEIWHFPTYLEVKT